MFSFFSFRKRQEDQLQKIPPLIITKLDRIIELLEQQKEHSGSNIHFDDVHIDHLENIVFHLDNIEIDELSGKLMIGNNINATEDLAKTVAQKFNKENAKQEAMTKSDEDDPNITKTLKGYRFRNKF